MYKQTYTTSQILEHMTPATLSAWIADMDDAPEELDADGVALMQAAITELFAIVGMEALTMLASYDVSEANPLVMAVVAAYNEDGE